MKDFGVIIGCCAQDYHFVQGTCASVRYFLGDIPICLLVDGDYPEPVKAMEKAYNVLVLNRPKISNEFLRNKSFGWGLNKMICFWESPWEHFLYMDSDTNVWGNILAKIPNIKDYDIVMDKPLYTHNDENINRWFFDIPKIEKFFPDFNWSKHRSEYACPGVIFGKRGIFSLEEYQHLLDLNFKNSRFFKMGDMGLINFMIFRGVDQGKINLLQQEFQFLTPDFDYEYAKNRFPINENGPVVTDENALLIHWAGPKPYFFMNEVYIDPMTFTRKKFLRDAWGIVGWSADLLLKIEDIHRYNIVMKNKVKKKLRALGEKK